MKRLLITGGTVFVSRYTAEYFVSKGYEVYVLNRGTKSQSQGVHWIQADRHCLGNQLSHIYFDVIIDICAYDEKDIFDLVNALGNFQQYIMISSSAVYPEYEKQPFQENAKLDFNCYWQDYGVKKIAAEKALLQIVPDAYIIRPPYLYGPMNNIYREAFVFECALKNRPFYIPKDGSMMLQFFHINDLCRFMECLILNPPSQHIFNVGNPQLISVVDWVRLCYQILHKNPEFVFVNSIIDQRKYFPFYDYEYQLDIQKQNSIMPMTISLEKGLLSSYQWYQNNHGLVRRKPFIEYIDDYLLNLSILS